MSNILKLLAVLALCLLSTIVGHAQVASGPFVCYTNAAVPPTVRSEGLTELVGDIIMDCTGGVPTLAGQAIPQVNFTLFTNTNVTSRILNASNNLSEAIMTVDEPTTSQSGAGNYLLCNSASGCSITGTGVLNPGGIILAGAEPYAGTVGRPNVFQGIVTGNQVQFLGVPVDPPGTTGHRVFRFANIRVNATGISAGASGTPGVVQALLSISGAISVPINSPSQVVAFVQPGMVVSYRNRSNFANSNTSTDLTFAQGASLSRTGSASSFIVRFSEGFASSFKTIGSANQTVPGQIYNTESGLTSIGVLGSIGRADAGTRLKAVFNNIPAGVNIYASLTNYAASGTPIWNGATLRSGEFGEVTSVPASYTDFVVPPAITNTVGNGGYGQTPSPNPAAGAQLAVVNGTATAVWEVTAANALSADNYDFVVWWSYTAGVPPLGTAIVSGSYAPTPSSLAVAASTAAFASSTLPAPRFADPTTARAAFIVAATPIAVSIVSTSPLMGGSVGVAYAQTLSASGGTGSYTWSRISGSLPAGLSLSNDGTISGVPTATINPATFRIRVTDTLGVFAERDYTLTIANASVAITTASPLPTGTLSVAYSQTLVATGGTAPFTWSLLSGSLPVGLTLSSNGTISGTPTVPAMPASFRIRVTDSGGLFAVKDFTLTVPWFQVSITTTSPLPGKVGAAYSYWLGATGGIGPYSWSIIGGALPAGLALNSNGRISGTPTAAVNSLVLRVRATDMLYDEGEVNLVLTINPGGPTGVSDAIVWYSGDYENGPLATNQINGYTGVPNGAPDSTAYQPFTVKSRTRVTSVFSNNFSSGFQATGALWEIRSGVSAGNGGTIVAAGVTSTGFSWTPTGMMSVFDEIEYSLVVGGLNTTLEKGTYWLAVVPIGNGTGKSTIGGTRGAYSIGAKSYDSLYIARPGYYFQSVGSLNACTPNQLCAFSMGIGSADGVPIRTSRVGSYTNGRWRMDVSGNGSLDSTGDRDFFLGWTGATTVTGDWNGDGKTKVGVYSNGYWFLDYDGNGVWDNGVQDKLIAWGWVGAAPMVGDWNGDGRTKIGVYSNGFWFLDYNGDYLWDGGIVDKQVGWGWAGVTPFVGDWNGNGKTKIGVYVNGFWFLDYDGNYYWDGGVVDKQVGWGWSGVTPIVGDWNGSGKTKIGVYAGGYWYLDYDGNYLWQYPGNDRVWSVGWTGTTPVMGDWSGDGKTKAGAFINGYWYLDYDGNGLFEGIGTDRIFAFGSAGDTPVVGNW